MKSTMGMHLFVDDGLLCVICCKINEPRKIYKWKTKQTKENKINKEKHKQKKNPNNFILK